MPDKKPAKSTSKAPTKPTSFKPTPTATPRYVAPTVKTAAQVVERTDRDDSWELAIRFWWAQIWRNIIIIIPFTVLYEISNKGGMITLLYLAISIVVPVAVVRHMLRKKQFKGFTFILKGRE